MGFIISRLRMLFYELCIGTVRQHVYAIIVCAIARFSSLHVHEFLGETHVKHTIHTYYFANHCGCWCIPMLLPRSLHQSLHVIVVIRKKFYLSQLVVVNAHTTLRAVVHGQRCCFTCSKDLFPI